MSNSLQPTSTKKGILGRIIGIGSTIIIAGAGIAEFSGYSIRDMFSSDPKLPTSVTVFVHGKAGKHDLILRQKGEVSMDVKGGERKEESIDDKGTATFKNVIPGQKVYIDIKFSQPYRAVHKDSLYEIPEDGIIYLETKLMGIDLVRGYLSYMDKALPGVIVKLVGAMGNMFDTTDQMGDFLFNIPDSQQLETYQISYFKEGFKPVNTVSTPETGVPLKWPMVRK